MQIEVLARPLDYIFSATSYVRGFCWDIIMSLNSVIVHRFVWPQLVSIIFNCKLSCIFSFLLVFLTSLARISLCGEAILVVLVDNQRMCGARLWGSGLSIIRWIICVLCHQIELSLTWWALGHPLFPSSGNQSEVSIKFDFILSFISFYSPWKATKNCSWIHPYPEPWLSFCTVLVLEFIVLSLCT